MKAARIIWNIIVITAAAALIIMIAGVYLPGFFGIGAYSESGTLIYTINDGKAPQPGDRIMADGMLQKVTSVDGDLIICGEESYSESAVQRVVLEIPYLGYAAEKLSDMDLLIRIIIVVGVISVGTVIINILAKTVKEEPREETKKVNKNTLEVEFVSLAADDMITEEKNFDVRKDRNPEGRSGESGEPCEGLHFDEQESATENEREFEGVIKAEDDRQNAEAEREFSGTFDAEGPYEMSAETKPEEKTEAEAKPGAEKEPADAPETVPNIEVEITQKTEAAARIINEPEATQKTEAAKSFINEPEATPAAGLINEPEAEPSQKRTEEPITETEPEIGKKSDGEVNTEEREPEKTKKTFSEIYGEAYKNVQDNSERLRERKKKEEQSELEENRAMLRELRDKIAEIDAGAEPETENDDDGDDSVEDIIFRF